LDLILQQFEQSAGSEAVEQLAETVFWTSSSSVAVFGLVSQQIW